MKIISARGKLSGQTTTTIYSSEPVLKNAEVDDALTVLRVTKLPNNTTEDQLKAILQQFGPEIVVHLQVDYSERRTKNYGFIAISSKHVPNLIAANLVIANRKINFRKAKISVAQVHEALDHKKSRRLYPGEFEWLSQVRPGHPSYLLPEWSNEPFNLEPQVPSRASAHQLVDDVLIMIFKMLNVVELIKIERTCRRWQMFVRWIIGGHKKVDFADKGSLWGAFTQGPCSTTNLMIHKMLIVNGDTLESLNLHTVKFDIDRLGPAIKQTAPNLQHLSYIRKHYATEGCPATHIVTKQRGHNEDRPFS